MYSLVDLLDSLPDFRGETLSANLELFFKQKFFAPFSQCLALKLRDRSLDPNFLRFLQQDKAIYKELLALHKSEQRILSPLRSLKTLSKGQAICLYLAHSLSNFPVALVQELLQDSSVVLVRTYLFLDPTTDQLDAESLDLLNGDWSLEAKVKLIKGLPSGARFADVFYYYYLPKVQEFKQAAETVRDYMWFSPDIQRDAKILVQGPRELPPNTSSVIREFLGIGSVAELIEIVSSEIRRDSHGIVSVHDFRFELSAPLIKYLRGWAFMASHPASYADYKEIAPLTTGEYEPRNTNYFPCTLRNTVSVRLLQGTALLELVDFLGARGLQRNYLETYSLEDLQNIPEEGLYTLRETSCLNPLLFRDRSLEAVKEEVRDLSITDRVIVQRSFPLSQRIVRAVLAVCTWDVFFMNTEDGRPRLLEVQYDQNYNVSFLGFAEDDLGEAVAQILVFFRGVAVANLVTTYGYLVYSLDFVEMDGRWKLFELQGECAPVPWYAPRDRYLQWVAEKIILPVTAPVPCRLVPLEFVSAQKILQQFRELVQDPERMQFVGLGAWTDAEFEANSQDYYADAFKLDQQRDYFDWVLTDTEDNLLSYVSVRNYKYNNIRAKQIRVVSRVSGFGYGKRALYLAHNDYFLRKGLREMYAVVNNRNGASLRLFESLFPTWKKLSSQKGNTVYHCAGELNLTL